AVHVERVRPAELGQAPGRRAAEELELPEPVLPVAEADRVGEVDVAPCADVRDAQTITNHVDRRLEPSQPDAPARPRQWPAEKLVPEPEGCDPGPTDHSRQRPRP